MWVENLGVRHIGDYIQFIDGNVASVVVFHQYLESSSFFKGYNPYVPLPVGTVSYSSHHFLGGSCCPYLCGIVGLYFPEVGGMIHQ